MEVLTSQGERPTESAKQRSEILLYTMIRNIKKHRIATRLIVGVVLFSSLITLITTAIQLYRDYENDVSAINNRFDEIESVHLASIARSIWIADEQEINFLLEGIVLLPDMEYIEIREDATIWLSKGETKAKRTVKREYPLTYNYFDRDLRIGTLEAVASLDGVFDRLIDKAILILLSNAIKTFLVAGFILLLFHYLVTRHIIDISRYLEIYGSEPGQNILNLQLDRDKKVSHGLDELDLLVENINSTNHQLKTYYNDLNKSEEKYRLAMDATNDGLWDFDIPSRNVYYSSGWSRMLQEENVPQTFETWENRIHPSDKNRIIGSLDEHLKGHLKQWEEEHRIRMNDGSWLWVVGRGKVIQRDENGEPLRMIGTMTDISDRKKMEENLITAKLETEHALEILAEKNLDLQQEISQRKQIEEELRRVAHYDQLTNLPNKFYFNDFLIRKIQTSESDEWVSIYFKLINFTDAVQHYGRSLGDAIIVETAIYLQECFDDLGPLGRIGNEEFFTLIPLNELDINSFAEEVAFNFKKAITVVEQHNLKLIYGVSIFSKNAESCDELINKAQKLSKS